VDNPVVFDVLKNEEYACPPFFGEIAKLEWDTIISNYKSSGLFSNLDTPSMIAYCKAWEDYYWLEQDLASGMCSTVVTYKNGVQQVSAFISLKTKYLDTLIKFGDRLGLNPVARGKVSLTGNGAEKVDDFDVFMKKKQG
jgi:P27 family predicted phage terminase small subunit